MGERQLCGMQPLTIQSESACEHRIGTVERITAARMVHRCHVHPDLVGASRFEVDSLQADVPEGLNGLVMGDAVPTALDDGHLPVVAAMSSNGSVDGADNGVGQPLDEGEVDLFRGTVPEGLFEHGVGVLTLGHHHEAGGSHVETLHDPLPFRGATGGYPESGGGKVFDDARPIPTQRGVRRHASRFVHHDDVGVVVNDPHVRNERGDDGGSRSWIGEIDVEHLAGSNSG